MPGDILAVAVELSHGATQAHWRSAISRAYYASHHALKGWHSALPAAGSVGSATGSHEQLVAQLRNPDRQCSEVQKVTSGGFSMRLAGLLRQRVTADYILTGSTTQAEAETACEVAPGILSQVAR